jgi:hypothetical protein
MAKYPIEQGVPTQVSVTHDPAVVEIHEKLAGGQACPGSPAGSEAQPHPKAEGFVPGVDG